MSETEILLADGEVKSPSRTYPDIRQLVDRQDLKIKDTPTAGSETQISDFELLLSYW